MRALMDLGAQPLTMSSREIASLTENIRVMLIGLYGDAHVAKIVPEQYRNRHSEFVRENADAILNAIAGDGPNRDHQDSRGFSWQRDPRGYVAEFRLDYAHTMTLVSGYNVQLRHRIVQRWQQLETGAAPPAALDLRDIRQLAPLALQLVQVVQEQQAQLEAQRPKVEFADQVGAAENDQSIGDVAKALGTGERRLFAFLREHGVLLANNLPLQRHIDCGRFRVSERPYRDPTTGEQRMRLQTRVTGRGLTYLQQLLAKASETEGA